MNHFFFKNFINIKYMHIINITKIKRLKKKEGSRGGPGCVGIASGRDARPRIDWRASRIVSRAASS